MSEQETKSFKKRVKYIVQMLLLQSLYKVTPRSEWVMFHLGNAYAEHGKPASAIPLWTAVCARAEPRPAALRNLGTTLLQLNRPQEAIAPLQRLTTVVEEADLYALLGTAYRRAKRIKEAITAYEKSLTLHPDNDAIRFTLAVLLEQSKQPERALSHYQQVRDPSLLPRVNGRLRKLRGNRS